jgi:uncharacterized membrane-anchored protein
VHLVLPRLSQDLDRLGHPHLQGAAMISDTALSTEVETRATGTESIATVSVTSDTYQIVGTITATAARVVDEAGSFDASTVGNMATSFTFAVVNLNNGDSIQFTIRLRAG